MKNIYLLFLLFVSSSISAQISCNFFNRPSNYSKLGINIEMGKVSRDDVEMQSTSDYTETSISIIHEVKNFEGRIDIGLPKDTRNILTGGELSIAHLVNISNYRFYSYNGILYRNGLRYNDLGPKGQLATFIGVKYKNSLSKKKHFLIETDIRIRWDLMSNQIYPSLRMSFILLRVK